MIIDAPIFIVLASNTVGGAEVNLVKIAKMYPKRCILLTSEEHGDLSLYCKQLDLPIYHLKTNVTRLKVFNFIKLFLTFKPSIVYSVGIYNCFTLRFLKIFLKYKLIVGVRSNYSSNKFSHFIFRVIEKYFSFLVDYYITNCQESSKSLSCLCNIRKSKIEIIYNYIITKQNYLSLFSNKSIIIVANISKRKCYEDLLPALKKVITLHPDLSISIVGKDHLNGKIQALCNKFSLSSNVKFHGHVQDVYSLLVRSSIFVLPSKWGEGCPTSILEAQSVGLPVVAYKIDGIPELLSDQNNRILSHHTSTDLFNPIFKLLSDKKLYNLIVAENFKNLSSKFKPTSFYDKHSNIFTRLSCNL